jgi:hypothetical protein
VLRDRSGSMVEMAEDAGVAPKRMRDMLADEFNG